MKKSVLSALALLAACVLPAPAVQMQIDSPDKNATSTTAHLSNRSLSWSDKENTLLALVTVRDELHGSNQDDADVLYYRFPGVRLDPKDQTLSITTAEGVVVPIGIRKKSFMGDHVLMYKTAVIFVTRAGSELMLTLDVNTERNSESAKPVTPAAKATMNALFGPQN